MSESRTAYAPEPDPTAVVYAGLCATRGCQRHPDGIVTPGQRSYCTVHAADFLAAFPRPAGIEPRPEAPWADEGAAPTCHHLRDVGALLLAIALSFALLVHVLILAGAL